MNPKGEIILYTAKDGKVTVEVNLQRETVWLTQKQIAELFKTERSVITKHLRNIFRNKELNKESVCAKNAHTAQDGKIYQTTFYSLDVIISVGYRVNSSRATEFRIWATNILKKYLIDGYALNERRLQDQKRKLETLKYPKLQEKRSLSLLMKKL